jgi:hypothetical protein
MANWWEKNLTDKQKFRLQEPKDPSLLDVVSTVPNPVGDVASGLLAAQDVSKGNYGTAALNSLGLLPFVPSMGGVLKNVGKSAKTEFELAQDLAQRNATLPVAEGGLGLPANNTAMDRAKALGFDTSAYHGTNADIANFSNDKLGYATKAKSANMAHWSTNRPDVASSYANYAALDAPVSRLLSDADKMESLGKWDKYDELIRKAEELESSNQANNLLGQNVLPLMIKKGKSNNMTAMSENWTGAEKNINSELKNAKLSKKDSLVIHNLDDDPFFANRDATHYAIFNPSNIRSRFAAFDPFRRNEADILAGVAPVAAGSLLGLNTYNNMQEKPKKEKKTK